MGRKLAFRAKIVNGQTEFVNPQYTKHFLRVNFEGKEVSVLYSLKHNKRSDKQNRLYWLYLTIIADETGNSPDDLHRVFKGMFLPRKFVTLRNKEIQLSGSTTELSKGEFVEYLMKIQAEAGTMGIELPDPNNYDPAILL